MAAVLGRSPEQKKNKKRQRALGFKQRQGQAQVESDDGEHVAQLTKILATELCSFQDECYINERLLQRWHGLLETLPEPRNVSTILVWFEGLRRLRAQEDGG